MSIFEKVQLNPARLRTVAERRLDDARALLKSQENKHANGAMYLAGFTVECLLKAKMLENRPELSRNDPHASEDAKQSRRLLFGHDLELILARVPEVRERILSEGGERRAALHTFLGQVCGEWSVFARYSPRQATCHHAEVFVDKIEQLKRWLL